jgi:hypothetical protein
MFLRYCCHIAVNVCGCVQVICNYSLSLSWVVKDASFIVCLNKAAVTGCLGWLRLYMQWICHAWGHDKRDTLCCKRTVKRILLNWKKWQGFRHSGMWCCVIWCVFFDVWKDHETVFKSEQPKKNMWIAYSCSWAVRDPFLCWEPLTQDSAPHPRKSESSTTLPWEPQNLVPIRRSHYSQVTIKKIPTNVLYYNVKFLQLTH